MWKNLQELKKLEEAKILSVSWRSLKNQAILNSLKNVEELKKIEELKNLGYPERKLIWLIQPVGNDCVGPSAPKNVEQVKILAEDLEELKILLPTTNSHFS
jgi:hypothetical protein